MARTFIHAALAAASVLAAPTIFIAPNGNDASGDGSQGNPFATIGRAQTAVRSQNGAMRSDIIVYLRGGLYFTPSTISFSAADSGSNGFTVRYVGYPGDAPAVVHGGVPITGWTTVNASLNLWSAPLPVPTRQVYINGERANRTYQSGCLGGSVTVTNAGYTTSDVTPLSWGQNSIQNVADVEFLYTGVGSSWTECRCRVASVTPLPGGAGSNVTMSQPCWQLGLNRPYGQGIGHNCGNIENIASLLATGGQYYINSATKTVYYVARPGDNMATVNAIAASTETLIQITGDRDAQPSPLPVSFISFESLTFAYATWLEPETDGYVDLQSSFRIGLNSTANDTTWQPIPAHIQVHCGWNISFIGNTFTHLGMTALSAQDGSQSIAVINNTFADISCGGFLFGQVDDPYQPDVDRQSAYANVYNNEFSGMPAEYHDCAPITAGFVHHMTIEHNSIFSPANTGISLGWGWSRDMSPVLHDNRILSNYVYGSNWLLQDGGSIYTLAAQPNSEFAYNFCSDQVKLFGSIYHDEGSAYWHTHHNVVNNGPEWLHIWTSSIHDITVDNCWTNQKYYVNAGTNITIENITYLDPGQPFPAAAVDIMTASGVLGSGPKPTPLPMPASEQVEHAPLPRRKCRYCSDAL